MAAKVSTFNQAAHCCSMSAAACSSARIRLAMDTVVILAVSIFVALMNLRIMV